MEQNQTDGSNKSLKLANNSTIVLSDYSSFLQFLKMSRPQTRQLLAPAMEPGNEAEQQMKKLQLEFKTKMLWYESVLKPASVRYVRTIAALGKDQSQSPTSEEIYELILPKLEEELAD